MLKHIGTKGTTFLTHLLNLSLKTSIIPISWKTARIILLLKHEKSPDTSNSNRPMFLLPPFAKVLESLILCNIVPKIPLSNHKHGFRKLHSTNTALVEIPRLQWSQTMLSNDPDNTGPIQGFRHYFTPLLIQDILQSSIPTSEKIWLGNFLRGR